MASTSRTKEWLDAMPVDSEAQTSQWEWTTEMEIELFEAVLYYKPAGLSRDFNIAFILDKLCESDKFCGLTTADIWYHLGLYFNLDRADAIEEHLRQRISKDDAAVFDLPKEEFGKAMEEKLRQSSSQKSEKAFPVHKRSTSTSSGGHQPAVKRRRL